MASSDEGKVVATSLLAGGEDQTPLKPPQPLKEAPPSSTNASLKKHLLGPSVGKSGQDNVDQSKVAEIIFKASKGSKYFTNESRKDSDLTRRIERILKRKVELDKQDLFHYIRKADEHIASLEAQRDLSQVIVHVDCDAFYASVEELDHPEYKTVPMAVGKGVLTTCNYEARKFGCRSGMASHIAMLLCPHLISLPLNFAKYSAKAKEIREVLCKYDPRYEAASVDEAYLNITKYLEDTELTPEEAVAQLREEVFLHSKVTISAGIAPNARIAKIASNKNKPNGQFRIHNDRPSVMSFMSSLPVRKVNGVGRVFERELEAVSVKTCGDIYAMRGQLEQLFGEKAYDFLLACHLGLGRTEIIPSGEYIRKSIGTESTFHDLSGTAGLREKLRHTAESLEEDLVKHELAGRVLHLKIKQHNYVEAVRQKPLPRPISKAHDLYEYALSMLSKLEAEFKPMKLRLMGLRLTSLVSTKKEGDPVKDFFNISKKRKGLAEETAEGGEEWESWPEDEWTKFDGPSSQKRKMSEEFVADGKGEWESWPEQEFTHSNSLGPASNQQPITSLQHAEIATSILQPHIDTKQGRMDEKGMVEETTYTCPICHHSQPANDKQFNEHVDYCLSKQTIREAVKESSLELAEKESSIVDEDEALYSFPTTAKSSRREVSPVKLVAPSTGTIQWKGFGPSARKKPIAMPVGRGRGRRQKLG